jgi:hypothetical protein
VQGGAHPHSHNSGTVEEGLIDEDHAHRYLSSQSFMILAWPKRSVPSPPLAPSSRSRRSVFVTAVTAVTAVGALLLFSAQTAFAAPPTTATPKKAKEPASPDVASRVAVLAPKDSGISARLERNVSSMSLTPATGTIVVCTRQAVTRLIDDLDAGSALCADGDTIGVWVRDGDHLILKDMVVMQSADDRGQEVSAARGAMILRAALSKKDTGGSAAGSGSITIIANGPNAGVLSGGQPAWGGGGTAPVVGRDAPAPSAPIPKPPRVAPRLVVGLGPGAMASRDGTSFALHAEAQIGFSRNIALVPWLNIVPSNRDVNRPEGSAEFRPTIFGLGFSMPFLPNSSFLVPRLGGGYGIVWMHVSPVSAQAPAIQRKPEDLLAPMMYISASVSMALSKSFRVSAEGMGGVTSHDMVVRIAHEEASHWGVPLGALSLRGEWVLE